MNGETPCTRCDGRGEYPVPTQVYFDDLHGFDAVDEWVECLDCDNRNDGERRA